MKYSKEFVNLVGVGVLASSFSDDMPALFQEALDAGWVYDDGAWLLRRFRDSFHGSRDKFKDQTSYEAAVNGRGIPDLGITGGRAARARLLTMRGYAFARSALSALSVMPNHPTGEAIVSVGIGNEDGYLTGSVTFTMRRDDERPYLMDDEYPSGFVILIVDETDVSSGQ